MLKNWVHAVTEEPVPPGLIYAMLLACTGVEEAEPAEGAGRIQLPTEGFMYWGEFSMEDEDLWSIPLEDLAEYGTQLDAAIWWPEYSDNGTGLPFDELRSDVDLRLVNPEGEIELESISIGSVFERIHFDELTERKWTLQVHAFDVQLEPQTVYWVAWVHLPPMSSIDVGE
jgi:hypothetical protein